MVPAYIGHRPHDLKTLELCTQPIARLLPSEKVKRLIICNYESKELSAAIAQFKASTNKPFRETNMGRLDGLNHEGEKLTSNQEIIYEFGDLPEIKEQLNLLESVA